MGLSQELVLLRGDPDRLLSCAEWHLPPASAAELPVARGLPWEQVSGTVMGKEHRLSRLGHSMGVPREGWGTKAALCREETSGPLCMEGSYQSSEQHR